MNPDLERIVNNAKEWQLELTTVSRMICRGPCLFQFLSIDPTDKAANASVSVYDGENDQGVLRLVGTTFYCYGPYVLPNPAYFRRGLYVTLAQNVDSCSVQYLPLRD